MYVKGLNAKSEFVNARRLPAQSNADAPNTVEITAHGLELGVEPIGKSHTPKQFEIPKITSTNPNIAMQCVKAICEFFLNVRLSTSAIPTPAMNSHPRVKG